MNMTQQTSNTHNKPLQVLRVESSGRKQGSVTRNLTDTFLQQIDAAESNITVVERDVARGLPFIDETWIGATFTEVDQRSDEQNEALTLSDVLVKELQDADVIVMGVPVYNFGIPATLKAWVDQIARAGVTFKYTDKGPVGLLEGKKAYVIIASGGMPIGSEMDFASGYLKQVLGFIGIDDVEIISAERLNADKDSSMQKVDTQIQSAVAELQASFNIAA